MSNPLRAQETRDAILRTVAYFDVIGYAPTWSEVSAWLEWSGTRGFEQVAPPSAEELVSARDVLLAEHVIEYAFGRIALPGRLAALSTLSMERTTLFARKMRRARRVASYLARFESVRFVALVNTTSLEHARAPADLDLFVVVRSGCMWTTRLFTAGLYRLFGRSSGVGARPDAVCLSYFVTDARLDLSFHMLSGDDPYYRYWFLSLLPLYDRGVARDLWEANCSIRTRHPRAKQWIMNPDLSVIKPFFRFPATAMFERFTKRIQMAWFPAQILERMNHDTSVIVTDDVLKFHVDDARERFRTAYEERLHGIGIKY